MRTFFLAILFLGLISISAATRAHADDTLRCEVVEIDASHTDKPSVDADLKDLSKSLKKGPFAAYNTFKKLARISKDVTVLKVANYSTPKGATELLLREIEHPEKKAVRLSLQIGLDDQNGKRYVDTKQKVDVGKFAIFARTVSDTESIVTAVGCK